jgi:hypothetical protein
MEESVVNLGTYSPFTLPNKGYYSADDAFLSTPPSTQEGSPTYTSGVLTSMLAATPWGPNLHSGWMGNGRNGISSQSASAFWYSYTWSGSCGTPEPPVEPPVDPPPVDPPVDPPVEDCCGGSSTSSGGTVTTVSGSGTSVGANHTQVRLQCSHTVTDPAGISRTFLLIQTRTNYTPAGQTSGDPVVTVLGTATLTIPQGQKISTQVSGSASLTYLRNLGGIAYVEMAPPPSTPNTRVEFTLLPVEIEEVSFDGSNYHQLKSDDGNTTYNLPHWVDANSDGTATTNNSSGEKNYPVSFTRNTKPQVGGKFKVAGLPSGQTVKIKASSAQGLQIPETPVTPDADGTITLPLTPASNNLTTSIQFHNADDNTAFKIDWEISIGNGGWTTIGSTKHTVYITYADPVDLPQSIWHETIFNLGCRNAKGLGGGAQVNIVNAIYGEFTDRNVQKVRPSSGTIDGQAMKYWGNWNTAFEFPTTSNLLGNPDRDGNCQAWSGLFRDILRAQGIHADRITVFPQQPDTGVLVKAWAFNPPGSSGLSSHPYFYDTEAHPTQTATGQGNTATPPFFNGHWITRCGGIFYDPSYGTPTQATAVHYENSALAGYFGPTYFITVPPSPTARPKNTGTSSPESEFEVDQVAH